MAVCKRITKPGLLGSYIHKFHKKRDGKKITEKRANARKIAECKKILPDDIRL